MKKERGIPGLVLLAAVLMLSTSFIPILSAQNINNKTTVKDTQNSITSLSGNSPLWSDIEVISPDTYSSCGDQSIAIGPDDSLHVVWTIRKQLWYTTKPAEGDWSYPTVIKEFYSFSERIIMTVDSQGTVHLVYTDEHDEDQDVFYMYKPSYGGWSQEELVSENSIVDSVKPVIAAGPDGSVHVAWIESVYRDSDLYYREKSVDGTWSYLKIIEENIDNTESPYIDVDTNGNVHLTWNRNGRHSGELKYVIKDSSGNWGEKECVAPNATPFSARFQTDSAGNVHLVWYINPSGYPTDEYDIVYRKRGTGGWGNREYVVDNTVIDIIFNPVCAVDNNGNVHVVYEEHYGAFYNDVVYRKRNNDGSWADIELVSTYPDLPQGGEESYISNPLVVADSEGGVHVIWQDHTEYPGAAEGVDNEAHDIFYRYREPSDSYNSPPSVPSIQGPQSGEPWTYYTYRLQASDPDGDQLYYTVAWDEGDCNEWIGPVESGETIQVENRWLSEGTYVVRCKVRDEHGVENEQWSIFQVTMPKSKSRVPALVHRFAAWYPFLEEVLLNLNVI